MTPLKEIEFCYTNSRLVKIKIACLIILIPAWVVLSVWISLIAMKLYGPESILWPGAAIIAGAALFIAMSRWFLHLFSLRHRFLSVEHAVWLLLEIIIVIFGKALAVLLFIDGNYHWYSAFGCSTLTTLSMYVFPIQVVELGVSVMSYYYNSNKKDLLPSHELLSAVVNPSPSPDASPSVNPSQSESPSPVRNDSSSAVEPSVQAESSGLGASQDEDIILTFNDKSGRFVCSLHLNDILFLESSDNYVEINIDDNGKVMKHIVRNTLKNFERFTVDFGFVRCHRKYIVNRNRIKTLRRVNDGFVLDLRGVEVSIPVTKSYEHLFSQLLKSDN